MYGDPMLESGHTRRRHVEFGFIFEKIDITWSRKALIGIRNADVTI